MTDILQQRATLPLPQHSSATNEHPTPVEVVEAARALMGGIDLDPASCAEFNKRIGAGVYLTQADDGLTHTWDIEHKEPGRMIPARVFLNPPGGKLKKDPATGRWIPVKGGRAESSALVWWAKLCKEWESGRVAQAVFVGFTLEIIRTSQKCPTPVMAFPRCYPRERLCFGGEDPTHANVIVWLPPRFSRGWESDRERQLMSGAFGSIGYCEGGS